MKIKIEIVESIKENEIIVRCKEFNDEVSQVDKVLNDIIVKKNQIIFYKGDTEYFFPIENILFFETESNSISAHTVDDVFSVKYKLYELEELLPGHFMRISKSTILNINHIFSISRNLTASSLVEFKNTHKKVYVSRYYYKPLKIKLLEKRK